MGVTGVQLLWAVLWGSVKLAQQEDSGQGGPVRALMANSHL